MIFAFCLKIQAQVNLVLNPSFEDTLSMTNEVIYPICANWWNPNASTADYFSPPYLELDSGFGEVLNAPYDPNFGFQQASFGSSYLGLITYDSVGDTKEYAQGFLSDTLVNNTNYCIEIWISLLDSSAFKSCDFQIAFTEELVNNPDLLNLNLANSVDFDLADIDTINWKHYEGAFFATGGERYIYLGSNTPNAIVNCEEMHQQTWLSNFAYILIDSVSVKQSVNCSVGTEDQISEIFLYPNPTSSEIQISLNCADSYSIRIMDHIGNLVYNTDFLGRQQLLDLSILSAGVYILDIKSTKSHFIRRIIKN